VLCWTTPAKRRRRLLPVYFLRLSCLPGGGGDASEEVTERKKANELYEDFGLVTGIRLELCFRDRHVTTYHRNYKEHLQPPTRG